MPPLERLHAIAQTPLRQWRELFPDQRPVGIYNAYVPEEMFHAAGLTPVYVFHRSGDGGRARAHLPSFACWPGRSLVDQALSGELDGLAGMAFGQSCDMLQALTDVWRKAMPGVPVYHVGAPLSASTEAARAYLNAELQRLRQALGGLTDDALRQSIALYNHTRALVSRLYDQAAHLPPTDLYAALRAGFLMPKSTYNALLTELLDKIAAHPKAQFPNSPLPTSPLPNSRLILIGPHLADPSIYRVIQEAGGRVVDDALDIGRRYFDTPVKTGGDPIAALGERLLNTLPTPNKRHPTRRRDDYVVQLVAQRQADGVIFARQKFCDPHGFDYASLKPALDRANVPHLLLELEQTSQAGQMSTRVGAFIEMVGGREVGK
jgi:bcr-type benzoyl-CoA reductase subunit C